jgi:predicted dithiol-disulfide oxidoreductase (DUF899 family)
MKLGYSTYARGLDVIWGMYQWLDRAPKETGVWWRRHDKRPNHAQLKSSISFIMSLRITGRR